MTPALPITLACLLSLLPATAALAGSGGFDEGFTPDQDKAEAQPSPPRPPTKPGRTEGIGPGGDRGSVGPDDADALVNPCHASPQPTWCDQ